MQKGDRVKISLSNNIWAIGTVLSAENNNFGYRFKQSGAKTNWYIELDVEKSSGVIPLGYTYWKQGEDGGWVEHLAH